MIITRVLATMLAAAAVLTVGAAASAPPDDKVQITAWAVNMSNIGTGGNATVEFVIDKWSPPEEREQLITTMMEQGQDELLRVLQGFPAKGRMRFPAWQGPDPFNAVLGWELHYAAQRPLPGGGRRITAMLDRYMSMWELANRPRTVDYPFTFIEIRVNKNGEGEGKLAIATKVNFDRKSKEIELENYASESVRLQNVRVKPRT